MAQEVLINILQGLVLWLLYIFLPAYIIYFISIFFHELNHLSKAEKHNVNILKKKEEFIKAGQEKLLKGYILFLGMLFSFFGGRVVEKEGDIEKLKNFDKQKEIILAGIKSDIVFMLVLAFIFFLMHLANLANFIDLINNQINGIFALSFFMILVKTFDNLFDPLHKGGDMTKLLELKQKVAKT